MTPQLGVQGDVCAHPPAATHLALFLTLMSHRATRKEAQQLCHHPAEQYHQIRSNRNHLGLRTLLAFRLAVEFFHRFLRLPEATNRTTPAQQRTRMTRLLKGFGVSGSRRTGWRCPMVSATQLKGSSVHCTANAC